MIRHLVRRSWLVVVLAAIAGVTAWASSRADEPVYETRLTFVVRPDADLTDAEVPDAVRNLGDLRTTVATVLSTRRFLEQAAEAAGLGRLGSSYDIGSSVEGDSDIVEIRLRGPDGGTLQAVGEAFVPIAGQWVEDVYRVYSLEPLAVDAPADPVGDSSTRLIVLAAIVGALLALGVAYLEWKAREASTREARRHEADEHDRASLEDLHARLDRVEGSLAPTDGEAFGGSATASTRTSGRARRTTP